MIVEEIMKTEVITLSKDDSIANALRIMTEKRIRHIPVVGNENNLIGLVTDRDIRDAAPSIFDVEEDSSDLEKPVKKIMKTSIVTAHPLDFVEEIAGVLYEHNIGCLPIVQENRLVGIVTATDLLYTFVELTGANQPGSQLEVKVPNKSGMLCEIASIIGKRRANIQSVLVYPDKRDQDYKILVLRLQTMNPTGIIEDLKQAGHHVLWPNLPGVSS